MENISSGIYILYDYIEYSRDYTSLKIVYPPRHHTIMKNCRTISDLTAKAVVMTGDLKLSYAENDEPPNAP
jgi:hypothetical protein